MAKKRVDIAISALILTISALDSQCVKDLLSQISHLYVRLLTNC